MRNLRGPDPHATWTEDEGRAALEAWRASGDSLAAFARRERLDVHRLSWWKCRLGWNAPPPARFAADPVLVDHVLVDHVKQDRPPACAHGCADLATGELTGSGINHWVHELPEIRPVVTEHQCLDVRCATCGLVTRGALPAGVPTGQSGSTVQAMTGLLRGELTQSVRQTRTLMTEVRHVPMSTGMVAKTPDQVSGALAPSFQDDGDRGGLTHIELRLAVLACAVLACAVLASGDGEVEGGLEHHVAAPHDLCADA